MSQTRPGAEKLLNFGIISLLAKCDYLNARPESNQLFMGMNAAT